MSSNDGTINADAHTEASPATLASLGLSVVRDDPAFRLQQKLGLIPQTGLGIVRRALFWSMLAWLPIAVWSVWVGQAVTDAAGEPLLAHFSIHIRFLVAVPLLIVAESAVHRMSGQLFPRFVTTGIVPADQVPAMQALIGRLARLRNAVLPWVAILGIVIAALTVSDMSERFQEVKWATDPGASRNMGFGGWWFLYVGRPIYLTLLLGWAWRIVLLSLLFRGIAGLKLSIVPTHPDRAGGLGFLARFPAAFAPVVLAVSAVTGAMLVHDLIYHDISVMTFQIQMALSTVLAILVCLLPMLAFAGVLVRARRQALLDYGALVGQHGRLVHERWIEGKPVGHDKVLDAPELGSVADVAALFTAVRAMRPVPLTLASVLPLLLAAFVPLLLALVLEVPVGQLLTNLLKILI